MKEAKGMAKQGETLDTMRLWNQVCASDPVTLKRVNVRGGFTAIEAQSQIKRATELWGSYGAKWGVKDCKYAYVRDAGYAMGNILEVTLEGVFFYPGGEFQISTDEEYKPGGDSRKKLLTDLTTKALSKLGFNSDVFEGKFDGNKYTTGTSTPRKASAAPPPTEEASPETVISPAQVKLFQTIRSRAKVSEEKAHEILRERFKCESVTEIKREWFHEALDAVKEAGNGGEDPPF